MKPRSLLSPSALTGGRAGFVPEDTSYLNASSNQSSSSRVESALTSAATFQHRKIDFIRPQNPNNARPPSVADDFSQASSKDGKQQSNMNAANGTTVVVYRPHQEKQSNKKDDLKTPSSSLYPLEKIERAVEWASIRSIGRGLHNLGNTCFLNAALQCLSYSPALANFFASREHSQSCRITKNSQGASFCVLCAMEKLQTDLFDSSKHGPVTPSYIVRNLKVISSRLRLGRQEDSHEFIRLLLESMHKNFMVSFPHVTDERVKETSVIHRIFGGYFRSQVKCMQPECGHCSNTYDAFLDLSLDVYRLPSVQDALKAFTKVDILEGDNAYKCSGCNKKVKARKRLTIYRTPPVLTIQLKRFQFVQMFGGAKINKPVLFTEKLDLAPFLAKPETSRQEGSNLYRLFAVLVHSGSSTNCGHYYCYVKASNGTWYCCDDSSVHKVSLNHVMQQQAYILFYTRDQPLKSTTSSPSASTSTSSTESASGSASKQDSKNIQKTEKMAVDSSAVESKKPKLSDDDLGETVSRDEVDGRPSSIKTAQSAVKSIIKKTAEESSSDESDHDHDVAEDDEQDDDIGEMDEDDQDMYVDGDDDMEFGDYYDDDDDEDEEDYDEELMDAIKKLKPLVGTLLRLQISKQMAKQDWIFAKCQPTESRSSTNSDSDGMDDPGKCMDGSCESEHSHHAEEDEHGDQKQSALLSNVLVCRRFFQPGYRNLLGSVQTFKSRSYLVPKNSSPSSAVSIKKPRSIPAQTVCSKLLPHDCEELAYLRDEIPAPRLHSVLSDILPAGLRRRKPSLCARVMTEIKRYVFPERFAPIRVRIYPRDGSGNFDKSTHSPPSVSKAVVSPTPTASKTSIDTPQILIKEVPSVSLSKDSSTLNQSHSSTSISPSSPSSSGINVLTPHKKKAASEVKLDSSSTSQPAASSISEDKSSSNFANSSTASSSLKSESQSIEKEAKSNSKTSAASKALSSDASSSASSSESFDPRALKRMQNQIDFATRSFGWGDEADSDSDNNSSSSSSFSTLRSSVKSNGYGQAVGVDASTHAARVAITKTHDELKHPQAGKRKKDDWDRAYDMGKVKKVKVKKDDDGSSAYLPRDEADGDENSSKSSNPFQKASDHQVAVKEAKKSGQKPSSSSSSASDSSSSSSTPLFNNGAPRTYERFDPSKHGGRGGSRGFGGRGRGGFHRDGHGGRGRGGFHRDGNHGGRGGGFGGRGRGGFGGRERGGRGGGRGGFQGGRGSGGSGSGSGSGRGSFRGGRGGFNLDR